MAHPSKGSSLEITAEIVGQNQPVSGPSEGSISIDFGALKQKASEYVDAANARTDTPEPVVQATTTVTPQPQAETPSVSEPEHAEQTSTEIDASARAALALNDEDLIEVPINGEMQQLSWKDAKSKLSGDLKFTQRMQEVAQAREVVAQERAQIDTLRQERDQLAAFVRSPQAMAQFLVQNGFQLADGQPAAAGDPNEIATVGEVNATIEQRLVALQQQTEQRIAQANAEIEFRQQTAQHAVTINSTLADIFAKNPVLNAIPNANDLIRYQVATLKPQTEAEAIEAFNAVSAEMVQNIGQHFKTTQKAQRIAEAKQKLTAKTIEPPGGAAPQQQPLNYKKPDGSVDWNALRNAAASMLG